MFCAYPMPRYVVSVYMTIGPLVLSYYFILSIVYLDTPKVRKPTSRCVIYISV